MGITLSSELTITLRDAIITGEIEQGAKLSETKLATELDVSRGPLREALRNLEGMNLVHSVPHHTLKYQCSVFHFRSDCVIPFRFHGNIEPMDLHNIPTISMSFPSSLFSIISNRLCWSWTR